MYLTTLYIKIQRHTGHLQPEADQQHTDPRAVGQGVHLFLKVELADQFACADA